MGYEEKFFTDVFAPEQANVIVFGVPLGKYSEEALRRLRETSWFVEPFDVDKNKNLLENARLADIGNVELKTLNVVTEQTKKILGEKKIPLMFGGNHLSTLHALKAFGNVKIVVFDAHCDLKDEYEDERLKEMNDGFFDTKVNDSTWLRRLCEFVDPKNIFLLGVRSCDEDEIKFAKERGIQYFTANQVQNNTKEVAEKTREFTKDSEVYVSVDVDAFDPYVAPAVDYPEPGGILFKQFSDVVNAISGKITGMDLCCLKPLENNQVTEFLTVKVIFEILGLISSG